MGRLTYRYGPDGLAVPTEFDIGPIANIQDDDIWTGFNNVVSRLAAYEDICFDADGKERITVEKLSALVKAQDEGPMAGDSVYVLERDEYGEAADVSGLMFLAVVGHCAILSPYIDEIEDLDETMEDHIRETAENMSTDLYVYPIEDVYLTRAEAEAALGGG